MEGYASSPGLRVALDEGVLRLTLDRADKRNAVDDVMMAGLIDAIDAAGRDEEVRVIVLAGYGASRIATRRAGMTWPLRPETDDYVNACRDALSPADFERAWRQGEDLSVAAAMRLGLVPRTS